MGEIDLDTPPPCPSCHDANSYFTGFDTVFACSSCYFEWNPNEEKAAAKPQAAVPDHDSMVVKDMTGAILTQGDRFINFTHDI